MWELGARESWVHLSNSDGPTEEQQMWDNEHTSGGLKLQSMSGLQGPISCLILCTKLCVCSKLHLSRMNFYLSLSLVCIPFYHSLTLQGLKLSGLQCSLVRKKLVSGLYCFRIHCFLYIFMSGSLYNKVYT